MCTLNQKIGLIKTSLIIKRMMTLDTTNLPAAGGRRRRPGASPLSARQGWGLGGSIKQAEEGLADEVGVEGGCEVVGEDTPAGGEFSFA